MPDLDLDAIAARADAATAGPWEWDPPSDESWPCGDESLMSTMTDPDDGYRYSVVSSWGHDACGTLASDEDRAFIAAARTDVPELVAAVRELRAEVAAKDARIGELGNQIIRMEREDQTIRRDIAARRRGKVQDERLSDQVRRALDSRDADITRAMTALLAETQRVDVLEARAKELESAPSSAQGSETHGKLDQFDTGPIEEQIAVFVHDLAGQYLDAMEAAGVRIVAEEL